ncbi:MAG: VWA domain-containing protein [Proteobacteria bacterium]|nr:VWA domain-containing protein [Pseudomonadota bacterium]
MPGIEAYGNENLVYLFFCIFLLIGLFVWSYHWKKSKMDAFAHIASMKKIADSISLPGRIIKRVCLCVVYLLLVFSLMRPQGAPDQELKDDENGLDKKTTSSSISLEDIEKKESGDKVKVKENARDIVFLLDVSASMAAPDLYPNRLEKAKYMIRDILSCLDGEHVALVVFTSVPSVKCILTLDYTYFKQILDDVSINDNDYAGTKFMPALKEIIDRQFDFSENKFKDLIVITDGGDTTFESLKGTEKDTFEKSFFDLAEKAYTENNIRIHTIGIGTKAGAIVQGVKDENGNPVKSSLNEEFLKGISNHAKGVYIAVEDSNVNMADIYKKYIAPEGQTDIEKEIAVDSDKLKELVQKQKEEEEQKVVYIEYYIYPLFLSIFILIAEFFIPEKKRIRRAKQ